MALGATALVLSLPVQALVAGVIRVSMGSPVLFRQLRPGRDGVVFELVKFRTMTIASGVTAAAAGDATADDEARLTPLGRFLRASSLDELPTLWNVVRGDMSLVGPRPLLVEYLPLYTARQARRHEVRPGVTGLAQVSGRNALSWEEKLELDVEYVDQRCLSLDLRVVAQTLATVLTRRGIAHDGVATMTRFTGS